MCVVVIGVVVVVNVVWWPRCCGLLCGCAEKWRLYWWWKAGAVMVSVLVGGASKECWFGGQGEKRP